MVPQRNWLRNYCHLEKSFFNAKQVERMGDKHIFLHDSKRTTNFVAVLLFFAPFFGEGGGRYSWTRVYTRLHKYVTHSNGGKFVNTAATSLFFVFFVLYGV
jgi:hypothetical protein